MIGRGSVLRHGERRVGKGVGCSAVCGLVRRWSVFKGRDSGVVYIYIIYGPLKG